MQYWPNILHIWFRLSETVNKRWQTLWNRNELSNFLETFRHIWETSPGNPPEDPGCPADLNVNFQHGKSFQSNSSVELCALSLSSFSLAIYVARVGCLRLPLYPHHRSFALTSQSLQDKLRVRADFHKEMESFICVHLSAKAKACADTGPTKRCSLFLRTFQVSCTVYLSTRPVWRM